MTHAIDPRRQLYNAISQSIGEAQASLRSFPGRHETRDSVQKVVAAFETLVSSIEAFIRFSPRAFSDISSGIGTAQDLLLDAAARLKNHPKAKERLYSLESELSDRRMSRAGQTNPSWLKSGDVGTGILLRWRAPSLDGDDQPSDTDEEYVPEKTYGRTCSCEEPPASPMEVQDPADAFLTELMLADHRD